MNKESTVRGKRSGHRAKFLALLVLSISLIAVAAWAAEVFKVVQREAAIRGRKSNISSRLAVIRETDEVTVLAKEPPWYRVKGKGVEGWIHESVVTDDPKVVFSSEAVASGVKPTEQSAGGRGFDREVEEKYRQEHPNLAEAYRLLDLIEKSSTTEEELQAFVGEGQLSAADAGGGK